MSLPCPSCGSTHIDTPFTVEAVEVILATPDQQGRGLLAVASALVGPMRIDGIAIRTSMPDDLKVIFPCWHFRDGRYFVTPLPIEGDALRHVEAAVRAEYRTTRERAGLPAS